MNQGQPVPGLESLPEVSWQRFHHLSVEPENTINLHRLGRPNSEPVSVGATVTRQLADHSTSGGAAGAVRLGDVAVGCVRVALAVQGPVFVGKLFH